MLQLCMTYYAIYVPLGHASKDQLAMYLFLIYQVRKHVYVPITITNTELDTYNFTANPERVTGLRALWYVCLFQFQGQ